MLTQTSNSILYCLSYSSSCLSLSLILKAFRDQARVTSTRSNCMGKVQVRAPAERVTLKKLAARSQVPGRFGSAHMSAFGSATLPQTCMYHCISADSISTSFLPARLHASCFIAAIRLLQFDSYLLEHGPSSPVKVAKNNARVGNFCII